MCQDWTTLPTLPQKFKIRGVTETIHAGGLLLRQHHLAAEEDDGIELTITELPHAYEIVIAGTPIPWIVRSLPDSLRPHLNLGA